MSIANVELTDGIILSKDLYKDNTLILKKGIVLDTYLINKLNKFGITSNEIDFLKPKDENKTEKKNPLIEVLIFQKNTFQAHRTKNILNHAGYTNENIRLLKNLDNVIFDNPDISLVFVDSIFYTKDLLERLTLMQKHKKINIFVLNCDEFCPQNLVYNLDLINVKYLYRPLATNYINALLKLYS